MDHQSQHPATTRQH